jgi:23S rRNA (adenine1618-N6)-methyltransferase
MLNRALLKQYYDLDYWDIPQGYLCPPIPGRADYIHYVADLLGSRNNGEIPTGENIKCLDIGVGANCVYPIIGNAEYGWSFTGTEIDPIAIDSAIKIIELNSSLLGNVDLRLQTNPKAIFRGIIKNDEMFDLTICNPPFHSSLVEARAGSIRKLTNLTNKKSTKPILNYGGQNSELWCEGGELRFVDEMARESKQFSESCCWFSTLISKESNLTNVYDSLRKADPAEVKTISMGQGNKISRIVAWTFLSRQQQEKWISARWNRI